ncbi:hypothetical protein E4U17_002655 [Claviceps sp. LM77 group G4]|nr:hypothetical protein E4U17_002655 [Claviceps sp. LM77 group G4]KAG6074502.1 hypothetical protein E4U33_002482 [Claviceps sp. LM78 group G4]KAG6082222.1 hypothetical protein E4U16_006377 [Claviceps sp. LM84 group G4]
MAAAAVSPRRTLSPSGAGEVDVEDDNASSPLSEVDDGDANEDDLRHMQIDPQTHDDGDSSSAGDDELAHDHDNNHDRSDSDSVLSEADSDDNSEANDTEAETERLYDTPKLQRQRVLVFDQYSDGRIFEHTPSKLRSASRALGDQPQGGDNMDVSDEDVSAASADDSPTKRTPRNDKSDDDEGKRDVFERKRKRSPIADQSEGEEPLRKKLPSIGATEPVMIAPTLTHDQYTAPDVLPNASQSAAEDNDAPAAILQDDVADSELPDKGKAIAKPLARNVSKTKADSGDISPSDTPRQDDIGEPMDTADDEELEQQHEEIELDADEHDAIAKSIEEAERKTAAFKDWSNIEEMFGIFRDRLYKDRLQRLEEEEQSLLADEPTHPEYLNMKQCLDERLEKRIQEADAELALRLEAHERRAVAIRAQIWSQFFQAVRERREAALESLNRQWYAVQNARRSAHSVPDFGILFPKDQGQRVRNAIAYNTEVSTLAGLAKYEGFPAVPDLKGASPSEVDADFSAIEAVRRGRQKTALPARDDYPNPTFARLGPAGEQFIKDTPWANPHHSSHKLHQQQQQQSSNPMMHAGRPNAAASIPAPTHPPASSQPVVDSQIPVTRPIGAMPGASSGSGSAELPKTIVSHPEQLTMTMPGSSFANMGKAPKPAAP